MSPSERPRLVAALDRFFELRAREATVGGELRAAFTIFLTMAYILIVNPAILGDAIDVGDSSAAQLLTATAIAAAFGTLLMGLLARYPFALAPGMGLNAYFTYTVVLGEQIPWPAALGAVFISGLIFIVLSVGGIRNAIVRAIPRPLQLAIACGIGLFLTLIGLQHAGVVVAHPETLVTLGDVTGGGAVLAIGGLLLMAILHIYRFKAAILIGIAAVSVIAVATGAPVFSGQPFAGFDGFPLAAPVWPSDIAGALDLAGALEIGIVGIVFTFTFVDLFDTAGTLIGLGHRAGVLDEKGDIPRGSRAFLADALATTGGAAVGTSSVTSYIESAAGLEAGGRTGLTAVFVAVLFLLAPFFWPILQAVPQVATAPALILVGALMLRGITRIAWDDARVAVPALLTIVGMPFTFSIANGIGFGIIAWVVIHAATRRHREVPILLYAVAALLVARYVWLGAG